MFVWTQGRLIPLGDVDLEVLFPDSLPARGRVSIEEGRLVRKSTGTKVFDVVRMWGDQLNPSFALEPVSKDIPKNLDPFKPAHFNRLVEDLQKRMAKHGGEFNQKVLDDMSAKFKIDWTKQTDKKLQAFTKKLNAAIAKSTPSLERSLKKEIKVTSDALEPSVRKSLNKQYDLEIKTKMKVKDKAAYTRAAVSNAHYVRNLTGEINEQGSEIARQTVSEGIEEGEDSKTISKKIEKNMGVMMAQRSSTYYHTMASAVTGRSRSYSSLLGMRDGGLTHYIISSVLDEATTETCRMLHNTRLSIADGIQRFEAVDQLADPQDVNFEMPWLRQRTIKSGDHEGKQGLYIPTKDGFARAAVIEKGGHGTQRVGSYSNKMSSTQLANHNIGTPPYHGHCRTILIADVGGI